MYILGINAYHADASAAIFRDGRMIAATEEERFTRTKHWAGFPAQAIRFCLAEAGITIEQLDAIAIGRDPKAKLINKLFFVLQHPMAGFHNIQSRLSNTRQIVSIQQEFKQIFPEMELPDLHSKISHIEHHRSHLASAFYASPFGEAALVSIDGSGDFTTSMIGRGKDRAIEVIASLDFPHSMGLFYTAMTQYLGFPHYGDEYKIMGLAPYGDPQYVNKIKQVIQIDPTGFFRLDLRFFSISKSEIITYNEHHVPMVAALFSKKLEQLLGPARKKDEELTQYHRDIAASVQKATEEVYLHILQRAHQLTGLDTLCLAGGVSQNSVANGKILANTKFKNIYIPSAGHDAGIAMGAALYQYHHLCQQPRVPAIWSAYTGARYTNEQIEAILRAKGLPYTRLEDAQLFDRTVRTLVQGGVVGWFSGRAEFGPRALGARSILADPRRSDAKELLNKKIKRRESFRPFAPSILEEYVPEYFDTTDRVPFMEKVYPIRESKQAFIPAVTHVDGTGRLQSVNKEISPRYYQLIDTFRRETGIPILLNTSFNENEPIVNSPEQAIDCFLRTRMDLLVMENCILERDSNSN